MSFSYKSAIAFGLVYVPVTLHLTVRSKDIGFNMLYKKTGERIKYNKTCENCPENVPSDDIIKGYQYEKNKYVTLTSEELEAIKTDKNKSIDITQFVHLSEIDPIYFEKSYFVKPTGAEKAFKLIAQTLETQKKVGIAKTVLGTREQLVALRSVNGNVMLYTMHFHDEVQINPTKEITDKISKEEMTLATQIIDSMTKEFKPDQFKDEYRERLMQAIQQKIQGEVIKPQESVRTAKIINLMDALKASVATAKPTMKPKKNTTAAKRA